MTDDPAPHRTVTLSKFGGCWEVSIGPPLPDGDHRQSFTAKDWAWAYAQRLWTDHKAGFDDQTDGRSLHDRSLD